MSKWSKYSLDIISDANPDNLVEQIISKNRKEFGQNSDYIDRLKEGAILTIKYKYLEEAIKAYDDFVEKQILEEFITSAYGQNNLPMAINRELGFEYKKRAQKFIKSQMPIFSENEGPSKTLQKAEQFFVKIGVSNNADTKVIKSFEDYLSYYHGAQLREIVSEIWKFAKVESCPQKQIRLIYVGDEMESSATLYDTLARRIYKDAGVTNILFEIYQQVINSKRSLGIALYTNEYIGEKTYDIIKKMQLGHLDGTYGVRGRSIELDPNRFIELGQYHKYYKPTYINYTFSLAAYGAILDFAVYTTLPILFSYHLMNNIMSDNRAKNRGQFTPENLFLRRIAEYEMEKEKLIPIKSQIKTQPMSYVAKRIIRNVMHTTSPILGNGVYGYIKPNKIEPKNNRQFSTCRARI